MEGIILILTGLFLDIGGAYLILKPLMFAMKWIDPKKEQGAKLWNYSKRQDDEEVEYKHQTNTRLGFVFLVIGFVLQIIGNYLQYVTQQIPQ